jgi:hypothetical protein
MKKLITICAVVTMVLVLSGAAQAALVLQDGVALGFPSSIGSVRYRDLAGTNNNPDIYLGIDGLGTTSNRVAQTFYGTGGNWTTSNHFEFIYDKANDCLITNVTNSRVTPYQLIWNNFSGTRPNPLSALDYLQIGMKTGNITSAVELKNLLLDNVSLGSVSPVTASDIYKNWYLSGYDFSNGFTLSGDIVLTGIPGSSESGKVDITFGAVPEPATMAILGLGALFCRKFKKA